MMGPTAFTLKDQCRDYDLHTPAFVLYCDINACGNCTFYCPPYQYFASKDRFGVAMSLQSNESIPGPIASLDYFNLVALSEYYIIDTSKSISHNLTTHYPPPYVLRSLENAKFNLLATHDLAIRSLDLTFSSIKATNSFAGKIP